MYKLHTGCIQLRCCCCCCWCCRRRRCNCFYSSSHHLGWLLRMMVFERKFLVVLVRRPNHRENVMFLRKNSTIPDYKPPPPLQGSTTELISSTANKTKADRPLSADLSHVTSPPKLKQMHKAFSIDCEPGVEIKPKLVKNRSVESEKAIVEPLASYSKVHNDTRGKSMSPPGNLGRQHRSDSTPWLRRQFSFKEQPTHYLKHLKVHR